MTLPNRFWCPHAMLADGWAEDVVIQVDGNGVISSVNSQVPHRDVFSSAIRLEGAMLPGIPNLHSHAHQRAMAGLGEVADSGNDSFWAWRTAMYGILAGITPDQLFQIARMLYLEMLEAGYTHVAEFQYLHHDPEGRHYANKAEMSLQCSRAAGEVGIGFTALPVLYRFGGFGSQPPQEGQKRFVNDQDSFLEIVGKLDEGLSRGQILGIAPHSLRAVDEPLMREVLAGRPAECPVHIHVSEQCREVFDCMTCHGTRPVERLYQLYSPDRNWCLIHATHTNDEELRQIAESEAVVGLCPTTEANLGDGMFRMLSYLRKGGHFGIGSDSHISVSPVEEMRWLEYGQRLQHQLRNLIRGKAFPRSNVGEHLLMECATSGARACGFHGGILQPGARADFLILDRDHPRLHGREKGALTDSWIFSGNTNPVTDVVVAGRHVIRNGRHPEREGIHRSFRKAMDHIAL